jgi:hypothetical protein
MYAVGWLVCSSREPHRETIGTLQPVIRQKRDARISNATHIAWAKSASVLPLSARMGQICAIWLGVPPYIVVIPRPVVTQLGVACMFLWSAYFAWKLETVDFVTDTC